MAEAQTLHPETSVITETPTETQARSPSVVLKLKKPKSDKKVSWDQQTVDNEFMNKKKSKCCCIYHKPRMFGESSSDESDDDGCSFNCRGHKQKCYKQLPGDHSHDHHDHGHDHGSSGPGGPSGPVPQAS